MFLCSSFKKGFHSSLSVFWWHIYESTGCSVFVISWNTLSCRYKRRFTTYMTFYHYCISKDVDAWISFDWLGSSQWKIHHQNLCKCLCFYDLWRQIVCGILVNNIIFVWYQTRIIYTKARGYVKSNKHWDSFFIGIDIAICVLTLRNNNKQFPKIKENIKTALAFFFLYKIVTFSSSFR